MLAQNLPTLREMINYMLGKTNGVVVGFNRVHSTVQMISEANSNLIRAATVAAALPAHSPDIAIGLAMSDTLIAVARIRNWM